MTIIVFLVDTSASMQQKAFVSGRSTLLDVAKGAVEFFVKMRQKSPGEKRETRRHSFRFRVPGRMQENPDVFLNNAAVYTCSKFSNLNIGFNY